LPSYTEVTFEHGRKKVVMHVGLGFTLNVNGRFIEPPPYVRNMCCECQKLWLEHMLFFYTGITVAQTEKYLHRIENPPRCMKCGGKKFKWVNGYPGEELKVCYKCDAIVASHLNMSAIE
jgi:hypothetical protein